MQYMPQEHEIPLLLKFIEIYKVSAKLLHKTINQIATNFKNFMKLQLDVSAHAMVTYQGVFVPVSAFADYCGSLVQHIVLSIKSDFVAFYLSRVGTVLC